MDYTSNAVSKASKLYALSPISRSNPSAVMHVNDVVSCTCGTSWWLTSSTYAESDCQIVRIAALLHLAHDPHARTLEMGASEIEQAITLYDWLIQHQLAAQAISTTLSPQARAMLKLAGWIARQARAAGTNEIAVRLRQAHQHTRIDRPLLLECFKVMDELGYVAEEETRRRDSYEWNIPDVKRVGDFAKFYEATIMEGEQC